MSAPETARRIAALHLWYCETMGQVLPLAAHVEQLWFYWLKSGFNGPQLRKVLVYLRREIRAGRRNPGALKLRNLLDPDLFGEDLLLASHNLSADNKVPPLPHGEGACARPPQKHPTQSTPSAPVQAAPAPDWDGLKRSL